MSPQIQIDMQEVTRLTREGRLQEAMALLQGRNQPAKNTTSSPPRRNSMESPIDMQPPAPGSAAAWTAARPGTAAPPSAFSAQVAGKLLARMRSMPMAGARRSGPVPEPTLVHGGRFERHNSGRPGASRDYRLYVPASVGTGTAGARLPLVVMLHGCSQSPEDFALGTDMNRLAEQQSFLVAYPAQCAEANGSRCWNWFNAADQQRGRGEPALIANLTREIIATYPIDPARVYVAGLSAGGAAAAILAHSYPDLYAAVGVHSGLACGAASDVGSAFTAMRQGGSKSRLATAAEPIPTIVFHGDRDRTVHPVNGKQVLQQARAGRRLTVQSSRGRAPGGGEFSRSVESDAQGLPVLEYWILHGAGHAWSGGTAAGSCTDPSGPDASAQMMRFFHLHALNPTA